MSANRSPSSPSSAAVKLDENASSIIPVHGKRIVIIGDGPIALLAAVRLKQQGIEDVTVAGPRLGSFTRANDIIPCVFENISSAISPLSIDPSYAYHIKDIERQLYTHANKLGVKFINKKFDGFSENKNLILTTQHEVEQQVIESDFVFDCTGVKRDVIKKFNQSQSEFQFEIKKVKKYSKKHFASVRVLFHSDYYVNNLTHATANIDPIRNPIQYELVMGELHKLGWNTFKYPKFYINVHKKADGYYKSYIYSEIPENLSQNEIIKFTKILIKFSMLGITDQHPDLILQQSKKKPTKSAITTFHSNPHQTTPGFHVGNANFPMIFHLGDATADVPFHLAHGLLFGTNRLIDTFKCFTIKHGKIVAFDMKKFNDSFERNVLEHAKLLNSYEEHTQKEEITRNEDILKKYQKIITSSKKLEKAANIANAESRLEFIKGQQLLTPYLDSNPDMNQNTGLIIDPDLQQKLITSLNHLSKALTAKKMLSSQQLHLMINYVLDIAQRCQKLGEFYFKQNNLTQALWIYQLSIDIYSKLICSSEYTYQQLTLIARQKTRIELKLFSQTSATLFPALPKQTDTHQDETVQINLKNN